MIIDGLRLWIQTDKGITFVQVICDKCHNVIIAGHNTTGLKLEEILKEADKHSHRDRHVTTERQGQSIRRRKSLPRSGETGPVGAHK